MTKNEAPEGWAYHDVQNQKQEIKLTDEDLKVAKLFNNDKGKEVLKIFASMTIDVPTLATMGQDGLNTVIFQNIREGENNFYRKILQIINKVNTYGRK